MNHASDGQQAGEVAEWSNSPHSKCGTHASSGLDGDRLSKWNLDRPNCRSIIDGTQIGPTRSDVPDLCLQDRIIPPREPVAEGSYLDIFSPGN